MKFIPPLEISSKIMTLIEEANEELIIVSPYVKITNWIKLKRCFEKAVKRKVNITFFARENATQDLSIIKQLGIRLVLIKDLHAKLYVNEKYGIVTSQNLTYSSDINYLEIGYVTEGNSERKELVDFVNKYIGNIEARNNITFLEKTSEQVEVQKIALSTLQLEYLNEALRNNFPNCKLTQTIVPPENRTVSLVEKKQLNLQYVTAKKIQFRIQI